MRAAGTAARGTASGARRDEEGKMARFMNLLGGQSRDDKEIISSLNLLDKNRVPVRMEVENTSIHFNTRLSVKSATVIVAKPLNLKEGLNKGGTVRFKMPDSEGKELRMEVLTPHFNLTNGNPVFLCKIPTSFAQSNMRGSLRFNTSRFTNVALVFADHPEKYRIVDLSTGGCKVFLHSKEAKERFRVGVTLSDARIDLGEKASVHLKAVVPRNHRGQAVGCQFEVSEEGASKKYLQHLLTSLEKAELERYRT
jgi:PilZ domain